MANNQTNFKNIIFDLGAVIINIDPGRTNAALKRLVGPNYSAMKAKADKEIDDVSLLQRAWQCAYQSLCENFSAMSFSFRLSICSANVI